jgi:uncharacterized protein (TIGR00251 family)
VTRITVKVVPNAKQPQVKEEQGRLKVYVTAPPVDGKANEAVIETLAAHYKVRKSAVTIVRGETSREKVVDIDLTKKKG